MNRDTYSGNSLMCTWLYSGPVKVAAVLSNYLSKAVIGVIDHLIDIGVTCT